MGYKSFFLLLSILGNLFLGSYVMLHNPRGLQNRIFSLFIFNLVLWSFVNFLITISSNIYSVEILGKFAYAIGSIIPATFATFVYVFPKINKNISKKPLYIIYSICIPLIILSFTSLLQMGIKIINEEFRPVLGILHPLFSAYEVVGMSYGLWLLYRKWMLSNTKYEQSQMKFTFIGILVSTIIALISNVILPLIGISSLVSIGPTLTVIIIGFTAYTIVRYRLFDINIIVKKTAIYTILTALVTAFYIVGVLLAERLFSGIIGYRTFFPAVFAALLVAFIFLPLREKIQNFVDKVFGKKKYEYQRVLQKMGKELSRVLSLAKLLNYILKNITEAMDIDAGAIYLREGNKFQVKATFGEIKTKKIIFSRSSSLILWMKQRKDVVIREELERIKESRKTESMKDSLDKIGASIAVPIMRENVLTGIIFLKSKSSKDMFTEEDINLLLTLAHQAGVAIENARLYTQVEQAKIYQENILKNLVNAVIVTDKDGKVRIFNEKAEQITGLSALQVIGKNHRKILPEIFSRFIIDAKKFGKGLSSHEIEYIKDKGKTMILGVGTAVMRSQNNKLNGVTLVLADLTEIRVLEHQLNRAEELAMVGTLAAGMAHEIKNPLVAINTFLELLPEKYDDPEFRGEFSQAALEEVKKINDLIHRLLNFAQPKPPNFTLSHIHKCIDDSLTFMNSKLNSHNITVVKKYSPKVPESFIDKTRFDEVLLNLILNAVEAMEKGGKLYITTSYKKVGSIGRVLLKIKDTGEGISSENLLRIFDPFFTTKDNGTGLGLAIVYRAIADHGGKIEAESKVGKGTTFSISLPVFLKKSEHKLAAIKT